MMRVVRLYIRVISEFKSELMEALISRLMTALILGTFKV